jgi:hypothetical protein
MIKITDIYPRNPDDPYYVPNKLETDDIIESAVGMIKQIMLTKPGSVLGDPFFGIDLESLLFEFEVSQSDLEEAIGLQLFTYCSFARDTLKVNFQIGFFQGDTRDACVIEFAIGPNPVLGIKVI